VITLGLMSQVGTRMIDFLLPLTFLGRVLGVAAMLCPLGFCLGFFFPSGLQLIAKESQTAIPWAWGINCGFSVLGSICSIIMAQFLGFNAVLLLAIACYLVGVAAFTRWVAVLRTEQAVLKSGRSD
jgi:hypothetical protein